MYWFSVRFYEMGDICRFNLQAVYCVIYRCMPAGGGGVYYVKTIKGRSKKKEFEDISVNRRGAGRRASLCNINGFVLFKA